MGIAIAVEALAAALLAFILIYAILSFAHLFAVILSKVPYIGSWAGSKAEAVVNGAIHDLMAYLDAKVGVIGHFFDWLWKPLKGIVMPLLAVLGAGGVAIWHIVKIRLPYQYTITRNFVLFQVSNAEAAAARARSLLQAWTAFQLAAVADAAARARSLLQAWTAFGLAAVEDGAAKARELLQAWTAFQVANLESWTKTAFSITIGWAAQGFAKAEAYTKSMATYVYDLTFSRISHETTAAVSDIWGTVEQTGTRVYDDVVANYPDVIAPGLSIAKDIPASLQDVLAGLGVATAAATTFVDQCGVPMCDNLGAFGKDLAQLFAVLQDGLVFAFVAEAVSHPESTATFVKDDVVPMFDGLASDMRSLIGL